MEKVCEKCSKTFEGGDIKLSSFSMLCGDCSKKHMTETSKTYPVGKPRLICSQCNKPVDGGIIIFPEFTILCFECGKESMKNNPCHINIAKR